MKTKKTGLVAQLRRRVTELEREVNAGKDRRQRMFRELCRVNGVLSETRQQLAAAQFILHASHAFLAARYGAEVAPGVWELPLPISGLQEAQAWTVELKGETLRVRKGEDHAG